MQKKAEVGLQCSPRNFASWTWKHYEIHTYICVFAETCFLPALDSVECWKKKGLGIFLLNCQCPWRHFPCISAGALALKMNRNVCIWFWMQQVFFSRSEFQRDKKKIFHGADYSGQFYILYPSYRHGCFVMLSLFFFAICLCKRLKIK